MGHRRRGQGGDRGGAQPSRPRAGRLLGALAPTSTARTSARSSAPTRSACAATDQRRGDPRAGRRLRGLRPLVPNDDEVAALLRSGKNVVTPVGWIYPDPAKVAAIEAACARGRHRTLHGTGIHPGGITERFPLMVSARQRAGHPRARRGVLRHPHLRRPRRDPARHGLRRYAGGGAGQPDGGAARRRLPAVGADGGRRDGLRRRPARSRRSRRSRSRPRRSTRRSASSSRAWSRPGGSTGGRSVDGVPVVDRDRELADGRGAPRPGVGASAPRASGSRSRSPATRP